MDYLIDELLRTEPLPAGAGQVIGQSREGRPVEAFRLGSGAQRVSLIGGNHADEPVGPLLLRHLVAWLKALPPGHDLLTRQTWWIVPHTNPDGEVRNAGWFDPLAPAVEPGAWLLGAVRELPGDDLEFGFPHGPEDTGARPETRALDGWWRAAGGPFALHMSLHGMGHGAGPWFLIDAAWRERCEHLKARCRAATEGLGYRLHDVERRGEKGFVRLERGFCTRPDSLAMAAYFLGRRDPATAARFRPSSMEAMRALGGDCLTLVSEMPMLIAPGIGDNLGPPDPVADEWRCRFARWQAELLDPVLRQAVPAAMAAAGLRSMPLRDQMALQWTFIVAGLEQVELAR